MINLADGGFLNGLLYITVNNQECQKTTALYSSLP